MPVLKRMPAIQVISDPCRWRPQLGLTFIELIISMLIISISVLGILKVMQNTSGASADPMIRAQAIAIAEAYLEEITLKAYLDPDDNAVCPAKEGGRALYDNVCDYQGENDSGARDQTGAPITGLENYNVQVTIDTAASLGGLSGSGQVLGIQVQVTYRGEDKFEIRLASYRTQY